MKHETCRFRGCSEVSCLRVLDDTAFIWHSTTAMLLPGQLLEGLIKMQVCDNGYRTASPPQFVIYLSKQIVL